MNNQIGTDIRFSIVPETILDAEISDRAVRVYAILARYADSETGKCFPSRETLARRARCHWRSVDRAIQELIDIGAIEKHHRKNGDTYQSNLYLVRRVLTQQSVGTDTPVTGVLTGQSGGTDTGGNLTRTTELEPKELEPLNDMFAQFWSIYPLKKDKRPARNAFEKALKRVSFDELIRAVKDYRDDANREQRFTKYPASWLNADAWENGPEIRRGKATPGQVGVEMYQRYKAQEDSAIDFLPNLKGIEE